MVFEHGEKYRFLPESIGQLRLTLLPSLEFTITSMAENAVVERASVKGIGYGLGVRGLIVRDPYASQLLDGEKIWEIRGKPTQIRGPVVIVKAGTGQAFGVANLVRVLGPVELEDLLDAPELPVGEREDLREHGLPYRKTYAYVFTNPLWFERPISYKHPRGAVTWVRLPPLDLDVRYALCPFGASKL